MFTNPHHRLPALIGIILLSSLILLFISRYTLLPMVEESGESITSSLDETSESLNNLPPPYINENMSWIENQSVGISSPKQVSHSDPDDHLFSYDLPTTSKDIGAPKNAEAALDQPYLPADEEYVLNYGSADLDPDTIFD